MLSLDAEQHRGGLMVKGKLWNTINLRTEALNKERKLKKRKYTVFFFVVSFLIYTVITGVIFNHRIENISTHYALPDVDTDGGLWFQWYSIFTKNNNILFDFNDYDGYPFGYDHSISPSSNLIYSVQMFILDKVVGYSWSNLILVTNISSLMSYPLAAIFAAWLCWYLTRNKSASFIAGLIFGFSFYHIYMGRGQMSINHIEFIPIYFLSLFYYLNNKNKFSLILSALAFTILFKADAYYAFFSGIFSVIIVLFYGQEHFKSRIRNFFLYFGALSIVLLATNLNFFISNLYVFDSGQLIDKGRFFTPRNELVTILYYFAPLTVNYLYQRFQLIGYLLYPITLIIGLLGLFFYKKNKLFVILFGCLLLAILLPTYVPAFYWLNKLYFYFFPMFRSVGRIPLLAYLFLGLMVGMVLTKFFSSALGKKMHAGLQYLVIIPLSFIIIITGLNSDQTWTKNTDFSKINRLYEPLKDNQDIKVIVVYPISLNFGQVGFPQPYQLLGQVVHNKKLANGAFFTSEVAKEYQNNIKDPLEPKTIDYLIKYGVDTILIHNKILPDSEKINNILKKDNRLSFLGRYTQPNDGGTLSLNEIARDISVYQIKKVVENDDSRPQFYTTDRNQVEYEKIAPHKYQVKIKKIEKPTTLVYNYPYSEKWKIYLGNLSSDYDLRFLGKDSDVKNHQIFNEYTNSWKIDPEAIKRMSDEKYRLNGDDSIDVELTLFFQPYARYSLGRLISYVTLILCLGYLIINRTILLFRRREVLTNTP